MEKPLNDYSGQSVSPPAMAAPLPSVLSNDGNGTNSGHTRIYKWNGSNWNKLGSDIDGEAAGDFSGDSVSLASDGSTVAIGAYRNSSEAGHVRVFSIADVTAPTFSSAATNTDGSKVILTYNEPLSATTAAASAYTVTTDGAANAVTAVAISGSTVELTLTNTVKKLQTVTVAYTDPSNGNDANAIQDSQGNDAASLSSTSVTNNSTVVDYVSGLQVDLYEGKNFNTLRATSLETTVNINDQHDRDQGGDGNTFSIRATGQIQAYAQGSNTWKVRSNDGVRIWIDDVQVVNRWNDHASTLGYIHSLWTH